MHNQAKPTPSLIAAKKNALQRMGTKKQPVFSYVKDIYQTARDSKESVRLKTGIIYDNKMLEHECLWDQNYPECPKRLSEVVNRCRELGLLERCTTLEPRLATEKEILSIHTDHHLSLLKSTHSCHDANHLETISSGYDSIFIHPSTYECSLLAAGGTIKLVDEICNQKIQNGMAFVRPPGHHAMTDEYCGYCFFNNVVLGVNHALNLGLKRILIVDWDVHHGQATQQMFYNDPRVVYFSMHRYEHGLFWPNLRESDFDYIGEGPGRGFNFNIPLNMTGMSDADYLAVFHHVLLRMAYEFQPQLIVISAGYDSALGCPEGKMEVSPACYAHLITSLMSLASGKVAVILEGGYCIKTLAESAALTLRALLGDPCPSLGRLGQPSLSIRETIWNVMYAHREFWKCFRYHNIYNIYRDSPGVKRLPQSSYNYNEPKPLRFETRNCYPFHSDIDKFNLDMRLNQLISNTKLFSPVHKVCLVYDSKMMIHRNYEDIDHLEKPERISAIFKMHDEFNLTHRLHILKSRIATEEELLSAHSKNHVQEMKNLSKLSVPELIQRKEIYHSVYLHQNSFEAASLAAGCLLQVVDSVLRGESGCGVAVVRPPGHHADIDEPCGFCIFNSVAVAAKYATSVYKLKRVLILDWDVHHGNGTQEIFNEDSDVLYISIHRFDNGEFFPQSGDGAATQVGRLEGQGFNVNIPWNKKSMGNAEYVAAFFQVVLPIAYQYNPELVLISAGFDAADGDPLGGCKVTPEGFGHMTHWLTGLANGRVVLSLEGGYNVNSVAYSMAMCTKALLGDPLAPLKQGLHPCPSAVDTIREVLDVQAEYWSCLDFRAPKNDSTAAALVCEVQLLSGLSIGDRRVAGGDSGPSSQQDKAPPQQSASSSSSLPHSSQPITLTAYLAANYEVIVFMC
ncbi:hypothetical protein AAG570_002362 [Ranatra chinensis]|uniref:Histone deacetylase domain-containing protein n=1 Tax=Ranatra chinensis TaxID=642074 RepID=A0ABD0Y7T1_9HEMI